MAREILFDLGKMITDRIPYKLGLNVPMMKSQK